MAEPQRHSHRILMNNKNKDLSICLGGFMVESRSQHGVTSSVFLSSSSQVSEQQPTLKQATSIPCLLAIHTYLPVSPTLDIFLG